MLVVESLVALVGSRFCKACPSGIACRVDPGQGVMMNDHVGSISVATANSSGIFTKQGSENFILDCELTLLTTFLIYVVRVELLIFEQPLLIGMHLGGCCLFGFEIQRSQRYGLLTSHGVHKKHS